MPSLTTSTPPVITDLRLFITEPEHIAAGPLIDIFKHAFPNKTVQAQSLLETTITENSLVLAVTLHPVLSLALRLKKGMVFEKALSEWIQWANALLKTQRSNRRHIILVDPQVFTDDRATQSRDLLASRLSEDKFISSPPASKMEDLVPASEPFNMLCAIALLNGNPDAQNLMKELLAATLGASREIIDISAIEKSQNNLSERQSEDLVKISGERDLLRDCLRLNTEELERFMSQISNLEAQLNEERLKVGQANHKLDEEHRKVSELEKRMQNELLNMRHERDEARREAEKQKKNLKKVLATKSWRITAPLRAIRGRL